MIPKRLIASCIASIICGTLIGRDLIPRLRHERLVATIEKQDVNGVRRALQMGSNPNEVTDAETADLAAPGQTMLTFAVLKCEPDVVELLLQHGAKVNAADPQGRTPLVNAIECQDAHTVKLLLQAGADPLEPGATRLRNRTMLSPLAAAIAAVPAAGKTYGGSLLAKQSKNTICRMLLDHGAEARQVPALAAGGNVPDPLADEGNRRF